MPEQETSFYDDDDVYRSHRLPDMHGGEENASASPDPDVNEGEPRSQVALRKRHQLQTERVHGSAKPSLSVLVSIHETQVELLKTMKTIKELMEYQIPLGRTYAFSIAFPTGSSFAHIDFTDQFQNSTFGLPSGTFLNLPGRKLAKLKIFNDGPGVIKFSSNMPYNERITEVQLNAGEFDDSLDFNYTLIETLNIAIMSGAPTVRVFCVL